MNSLKTTIVCVVLLGVLYGMYQVINTPTPGITDEDTPVVENFGTPVAPEDLELLKGDPLFNMDGTDDIGSDIPSTSNEGSLVHSDGSRMTGPLDQSPGLTDHDLGNHSANPRSELTGPGTTPGSTNENWPGEPPALNNPPSRTADTQPPSNFSPPNRMAEGNASGNPPPGGLVMPGGGDVAQGPSLDPNQSGGGLGSQDQLALNSTGSDQAVTQKLSETWSTVDHMVSQGKYQEALSTLSAFYDDPNLTSEEQANLQTWLDALAAKVIYSTEHHFELPHTVKPEETLEQIANEYQVPPSLLHNINLDKVRAMGWTAGVELKVVPGPFRAEVNVQTQKLTLWLNDMYAGSFPFRLGTEQSVESGIYRVASKSDQGRIYVPRVGDALEETNPDNPYGQYLIDLGRGILIHGTPGGLDSYSGKGCIALEANHARDVYDILGRNSEVRIIR